MYVLTYLSFSIHNRYKIEKMAYAIYIPSDETSSDDDFNGDMYEKTKELVSNGLTGNYFLFQSNVLSKFIF